MFCEVSVDGTMGYVDIGVFNMKEFLGIGPGNLYLDISC